MKTESEVAPSYLTLWGPMDCSRPHSSLHGIFQPRALEWGAIAFSKGSSRPSDQTWVSCVVGRCFTIRAPRKGPARVLYILFVTRPGCELNTTHSQVALAVKTTPANAGDRRNAGSIPRSGRSPVEGHGNPFQYSCLENDTDRGAWWATVCRVVKIHSVVKSQTRLK